MTADVTLIERQVEGVSEKLKEKFGEEDLITYGVAPRKWDQAELCNFSEDFSIDQFGHIAVGLHSELEDDAGHEIHTQIGEESCDEEENGVADDAHLTDSEGKVKNSYSHGAGKKGKDGTSHGSW